MAALQDYNIKIDTREKLEVVPPRPAELWNLINHPISHGAVAELQHLNAGEESSFLPFEVRYQLEVCISRDIMNEHNISEEFIDKLVDMASKDASKARRILEYIVEQDRRIYEPLSIFKDKDAIAYSPKTEIPHYCAYARKATVTPSTIYFSSPSVETTNRVLRHYAQENKDGRFLRVQFTDEMAEVCFVGPTRICIKLTLNRGGLILVRTSSAMMSYLQEFTELFSMAFA
jgi:RNA-dependent RNA polymerase